MISTGKRLLCIMLALMMLILTACHKEPERNIYEGMSYDEFTEKNSEESYFRYMSYIFTKNNEGDHIVARVADDHATISKISCFKNENIDRSDDAYWKIKEGMTVEQIVSIVGIPEGSYTSGMITLAFESDSGARYCVYFDQKREENKTEIYVSSIKLFDEIAIPNNETTVQIEIGMSSKEVHDLLGSGVNVGIETLIEEYTLSNGAIVYIGYAEDEEGIHRINDISLVNAA